MNKKKLGFIIAPIIAGIALVGATLAAWAVTDNADPIGIKITPKENEVGDDSTMVLEWGDTSLFTDLSGFEIGADKAKASKIQVKSTVITETDITGGNLVLKVEDRTDRTGETGTPAKLIDHLVVEAYATRTGDAAPYTYDNKIVEVTPSTSGHTANADFATPVDGTATDVFFKIYISNDPEITSLQFQEMKDDIVYFSVDWNKPSTVTEVVTSKTVYFSKDSTDLKVYAWSSTSQKTNADWPGVAMTPVSGVTGNYWSYALNDNFDRLIFTWGSHTDSEKTADIKTTGLSSTNALWDPTASSGAGAWVKTPDFKQLTYSCIGTHNNWTASLGAMTDNGDGTWTCDITTTVEDSELKVLASDGMTYYDEDEKGTSESTECFVIHAIGEYTITFRPGATGQEGNRYIVCAAKGA